MVEDDEDQMGNFSKLEMQLKRHQNKVNSGTKSKKSKRSRDRKMRYLQREAKTNGNKEEDDDEVESLKKLGIDEKPKQMIDGNPDNQNLINPPDLKVVCDNMLEVINIT